MDPPVFDPPAQIDPPKPEASPTPKNTLLLISSVGCHHSPPADQNFERLKNDPYLKDSIGFEKIEIAMDEFPCLVKRYSLSFSKAVTWVPMFILMSTDTLRSIVAQKEVNFDRCFLYGGVFHNGKARGVINSTPASDDPEVRYDHLLMWVTSRAMLGVANSEIPLENVEEEPRSEETTFNSSRWRIVSYDEPVFNGAWVYRAFSDIRVSAAAAFVTGLVLGWLLF